MSTKAVLALAKQSPTNDKEVVDAEIAALSANEEERKLLSAIAQQMEGSAPAREDTYRALDVEAKILPLPRFMRRLITRITTRAFLRDVHEFLFDDARRDAIENSLIERLAAGGGPFVVIRPPPGIHDRL